MVRAPALQAGGRRFEPCTAHHSCRSSPETQRTDHIGNNPGPNGFSSGFAHASLKIEVSKIIIHKGNEPDVVVNFFDADGLAGKDRVAVNLFVTETDQTAIGDNNHPVVKRIVDMAIPDR